MKNRELDAQLRKWKNVSDRHFDDLEVLGHWGKYLCVLAAGFLENALQELFSAYARVRAQPDVVQFVEANLKRVQNPKSDKFVDTARSFDQTLAVRVEELLGEGDKRRAGAINSIMTNRHLIAHGKTSTISTAQVKEYFKEALDFLERLEKELGLS